MRRAAIDTRAVGSFLWLWGPVVVLMGLIFGASAMPDLGSLPDAISDKAGHAFGFGLLGALVLRALAGARLRGVTRERAAATVILLTLYGISDEFHQSFVPDRTPDALDVLADCAGAASAVTLIAAAAVAQACGILKRS